MTESRFKHSTSLPKAPWSIDLYFSTVLDSAIQICINSAHVQNTCSLYDPDPGIVYMQERNRQLGRVNNTKLFT